MNWVLRLTTHLGYRGPGERAQFADTVGTKDLTRLVEHAAQLGMAGVLYSWALARAPDERREVASALRGNGLDCSCIGLPVDILLSGSWCDRTARGRRLLEDAVRQASDAAEALGSSILGIFLVGDGSESRERMLAAVSDNLLEIARIAADRGMTIAIEPLTVFSNSLLQRTEDALKFVRDLGVDNVKLIFDTAHSASMGEDIVQSFVACFDEIALVQIADMPRRVEPGAGTLDIAGVATEAVRLGYAGLVDLEHDWETLTRAGEARGLRRLEALDREVRARVARFGH